MIITVAVQLDVDAAEWSRTTGVAPELVEHNVRAWANRTLTLSAQELANEVLMVRGLLPRVPVAQAGADGVYRSM